MEDVYFHGKGTKRLLRVLTKVLQPDELAEVVRNHWEIEEGRPSVDDWFRFLRQCKEWYRGMRAAQVRTSVSAGSSRSSSGTDSPGNLSSGTGSLGRSFKFSDKTTTTRWASTSPSPSTSAQHA